MSNIWHDFDKTRIKKDNFYAFIEIPKGSKNKYELHCVKNPCSFDGTTRREYVKKLISQIQKENPNVKEKMFNAILKDKIYEW